MAATADAIIHELGLGPKTELVSFDRPTDGRLEYRSTTEYVTRVTATGFTAYVVNPGTLGTGRERSRVNFAEDFSWLVDVLDAGPNKSSVKLLSPLIAAINNHLVRKSYGKLDFLLSDLDLTRLSPQAMVAIARTTSCAKTELINWPDYLARVRAELGSRGMPVDEILIGLS